MLDQRIIIFLSVCEHGTMTKAARALYMTQPAVSQAIAALEEQYQTKLFDRFPRRLQLTEAGRVLKETAQNMLREADEAEERMRDQEEDGIVRIGANLSVGKVLIYEYLAPFRQMHPAAKVSVNATRGSILRDMLKRGELDFLLMEESSDEDFIQEPFYKDRIVMVVRDGDPLLRRKRHKLADLKDEPFFLRERGAGVREQFDHLCRAHGIGVTAAWESSSTSILVNALVHGERGIAVLPYLLIRDELNAGMIRELNVTDAALGRDLYIVRHRSRHLTKAARDFIRIVKDGSDK